MESGNMVNGVASVPVPANAEINSNFVLVVTASVIVDADADQKSLDGSFMESYSGGAFCFDSSGKATVLAFFFKVSASNYKPNTVVSSFETFTLIPTCEFMDFIFSL